MSERQRLLDGIRARLGRRRLAWFGTRGADARPLLELDSLSGAFGMTMPLGALTAEDACIETFQGWRVDLDAYDFDQDRGDGASRLREAVLAHLEGPSVIVPYRPTSFVSTLRFCRGDLLLLAGVPDVQQAGLEHKPWVESELVRAGARVVPWRYYATHDLARIAERISGRALVLRRSRSSGGNGLAVARSSEAVDAFATACPDDFVSVAPYLSPHLPLNVNACVFPGGATTQHPPSVQLIGVEGCTTRPFGYCGNDYAAADALLPARRRDVEETVRLVGRWLASRGYAGAFGVDLLLHEGRVYVAELNPRFQGSSELAADIAARADLPDVYLDHLAAFLGVEPGPRHEEGVAPATGAQVLVHNVSPIPLARRRAVAPGPFDEALVPAPDIAVAPGGVLCRFVTRRRVTEDGFSLLEPFCRHVLAAHSAFEPTPGEPPHALPIERPRSARPETSRERAP